MRDLECGVSAKDTDADSLGEATAMGAPKKLVTGDFEPLLKTSLLVLR